MAFDWYVAQTKPNAEYAARKRLRRQGFEVYLPQRVDRIVRHGRVVRMSKPLFPSYLFVKLDVKMGTGENWRAVNSTRSVQRLMPSADNPRPIGRREVNALRAAEAAGAFGAQLDDEQKAFKPGSKLKVLKGSLAGQVIEALAHGGNTVQALWDCLGRRTVITVPSSHVSLLP